MMEYVLGWIDRDGDGCYGGPSSGIPLVRMHRLVNQCEHAEDLKWEDCKFHEEKKQDMRRAARIKIEITERKPGCNPMHTRAEREKEETAI